MPKRRPVPKYKENPFLLHTAEVSMSGFRPVFSNRDGSLQIVNKITGELEGVTGIFAKREVEENEFIKLYAEGVAAVLNMKAPGRKVFQIIYNELVGKKGIGKTKIDLKYEMLEDEVQSKISRATFFNGINENIKAGIIAESLLIGVYFINPAYIFNGNRLAIVKEYIIKGREPKTLEEQGQGILSLEESQKE